MSSTEHIVKNMPEMLNFVNSDYQNKNTRKDVIYYWNVKVDSGHCGMYHVVQLKSWHCLSRARCSTCFLPRRFEGSRGCHSLLGWWRLGCLMPAR